MEKYTVYITFEENFKIDETHEKILNLALPNIIDFKNRFRNVEIIYNNVAHQFLDTNDVVFDSLLKDIYKHVDNEDIYPTIKEIFNQQIFEALKTIQDKRNSKKFLIKRFLNYTPILNDKKFELSVMNEIKDALNKI